MVNTLDLDHTGFALNGDAVLDVRDLSRLYQSETWMPHRNEQLNVNDHHDVSLC